MIAAPSGLRIVLIGGLSRAGKSTLADAICAATDQAQHLPLDKYFHAVPAGVRFLDWVQSPASIDWQTVSAHLAQLTHGDIHTPVLDWRGSGQRLSSGGRASHAQARRVRGGAACYVIPGCHALSAPWRGERVLRLFVDTPLAVIAARCEGRAVPDDEVTAVLIRHLTAQFEAILAYRAGADAVLDGRALEGQGLAAAAEALRARLALARRSPA